MLTARAHRVSFVLDGGRKVAARPSDGLLIDEEGEVWPRCSILVGPYKRGTEDTALSKKAQRYFGRDYLAMRGKVTLPPRDLGAWAEIGQVRRIFYVRAGNVFGGTRFKHDYKRVRFFVFPVATPLYRHGRFLRLELPSGCIVNWRGFVTP